METTGREPPPAEQLTEDQRQGRACWKCGAAAGPLHPDGHAYLQTVTPNVAALGYAIAICTNDLELP